MITQLGDRDELEDVVKYLELEQQFSTKKTKVCEYSTHTSAMSEARRHVQGVASCVFVQCRLHAVKCNIMVCR